MRTRGYERVTFLPPGRASTTVYLEVLSEGERFLSGYEVTKAGTRVIPAERRSDDGIRVIDLNAIVRRRVMVMSLDGGELVEAPEKAAEATDEHDQD